MMFTFKTQSKIVADETILFSEKINLTFHENHLLSLADDSHEMPSLIFI